MLEYKAFCPNCLNLTTIIDTYRNLAKLNCRLHVPEEIVREVLDRISSSSSFLFLAK